MPPHLHPRSGLTTTLFTTTLVASFVVVGLPHIFPCPVPRSNLADSAIIIDSEGGQITRRRRRKSGVPGTQEEGPSCTSIASEDKDDLLPSMTIEEEAKMLEKRARECPVPKPGGLLGELLGFRKDNSHVTGDGREGRQVASVGKSLSTKDLDERGR